MPYPVGAGTSSPTLGGPGAPLLDPLVPPAGVSASQFTLRWFDGLPEYMRTADQGQAWQLLRYLSLIGDQGDLLEQIYERIDYTPPDEGGDPGGTSELIDPDLADVAWLPWLAQTVGARVAGLSDPAARAAIASASTGWQAGSKLSVAAAARTALTGSQYVGVYHHTTDTSGFGAGSMWDVLLVTRAEETPDPAAVIAAVITAGAKPAGVTLWHTTYSATWAQIEAAYPTWADRDGLTWAELEQTGL